MDTMTILFVSFRGQWGQVRRELGSNEWPAGGPRPLEFLVKGGLWEDQALTQGWESSEIPASHTQVHPIFTQVPSTAPPLLCLFDHLGLPQRNITHWVAYSQSKLLLLVTQARSPSLGCWQPGDDKGTPLGCRLLASWFHMEEERPVALMQFMNASPFGPNHFLQTPVVRASTCILRGHTQSIIPLPQTHSLSRPRSAPHEVTLTNFTHHFLSHI